MTVTPQYTEDTIVAAATPPGTGGVAIVRLSGPQAGDIGHQLAGKLPPPRRVALANIKNKAGEIIDRGMVVHFRAPSSFTGETVIELHCHGGPIIVEEIIEASITLGARRAEAGEFSKRAYLNGKLDLAQAEAIADLIGSGTRQAARAALRSLSGAFSMAVHELQEKLTGLRLFTEAALDFPEEEIDFLSDTALLQRVEDCERCFITLLKETTQGRLLRDGFQMVIVGRPNAGKSSLLNVLSGQESAIVTEVAGTTRDILREQINLDGLAVELVDTAGLRNDPNRIEAEGIRRAREAISQADAILWLIDANDDNDESLTDLEPDLPTDIPVLAVFNKADLSGDAPGPRQDKRKHADAALNISAKHNQGIEGLRKALRTLAGFEDQGEGAFTARRRHIQAIEAARSHFDLGKDALLNLAAGEIFAEELKLAQRELGSITGELSSDDLLGLIFSEFCIGK